MSRWADEFEAEILSRNPHAISAISAIRSDSEGQTTLMAPNGTNGMGKSDPGPRSDHVRVVVLQSEPYPDESDSDDPEEGRRILENVRAVGRWVSIERERIVLRWRGDFPSRIIDQIMAARTAVVLAAHNEDVEYDRLERDAIMNESDFDDAPNTENRT